MVEGRGWRCEGGWPHHVGQHHTQHPDPVAEINHRVSERKGKGHYHGNRGMCGIVLCSHCLEEEVKLGSLFVLALHIHAQQGLQVPRTITAELVTHLK